METKDDQNKPLTGISKRSKIPLAVRAEVIKLIESGTPRPEIVTRYGISGSTLCEWMRDHGSRDYHSKQAGKRLTETKKRTIVRQVEQGSLTAHEAGKVYGVHRNVLNRLLKASMKENAELVLYDGFEMKEVPAGDAVVPDPEKEALKRALEDARMKIHALNTLIDVAEDQFKIAIRKKAGARQS